MNIYFNYDMFLEISPEWPLIQHGNKMGYGKYVLSIVHN